jgi:hypothetical protein
MNRDRKQLASLSSGAPPQAWEMKEGLVMIGRCKDCKKKHEDKCPVEDAVSGLVECEWRAQPDFGCIYWESNETAPS